MVSSSKVLTVTYGTFSCTLEGFDDPFTTLQMVAEYFRKLAAEDRFFGGIPQVPDSDTLKRIAEENTPGGVAAEIGENGVILRQAGSDTDTGTDIDTDIDTGAVTDTDAGLQSQPILTPDETQDDATQDDAAQDNAPSSDLASTIKFISTRRDQSNTGVPASVSEVSASDDQVDKATEAAIAAAAANPVRPATATRSVEETLAAIRQNVEQAETTIETDETDVVTVQVDDSPAPEETLVESPTQTSEQTSDDQVEPDQTATVATDTDAMPEEINLEENDPFAETLAKIEDEIVLEDTALESDTLDGETLEGETLEDDTLDGEAVSPTAEDDDVEWFSADTDEDEPDVIAATEPNEIDVDEPVSVATVDDTTPESAPEPEQALETAPPARESSLSDAQESELARELDAAMSDAQGNSETTEAAAARRKRAAAILQPSGVDQDERALNRLLETTRTKMNKPEQVRRMNALDQLKAAVAATQADQNFAQHTDELSGDADTETTDLAAYREDLRRAQSSARTTARSGQSAAAQSAANPLILVSEQRIDEPSESAFDTYSSESRPEAAEIDGNLALKPEFEAATQSTGLDDDEIQGIPANAFADATSFSDFAERIGAFDLTDLLEAAAAYTSIIEEKPRFSRAQVMSKIAKLNHGDGYSKEAGLRAFGKLLREGKILRVQDGQFGISKASRFSIATRYNE